MADHEKVERVPSDPSDPSIGRVRDEKNPYEINNVLLDEEAVERLVTSLWTRSHVHRLTCDLLQ